MEYIEKLESSKIMYELTKRTFDLIVSFILIIIIMPLLLCISILILLKDGRPILFKQDRLSRGAKVFSIYKFRTMKVHSRDMKNSDGSYFNSSNDPRLTKTGKFLRLTSFDELPQLFNVFFGQMSLVGPRPDPTGAIKLYREKDFMRLQVSQGITGWAQVNGRNSISWEERRDLDIEYVKIRNFRMDILILFKTLFQLFKTNVVNHEE
jgi:undecaprenyl phosphate N,N'-diacetylbacillosamine 1-phosphate transferase